MAADNFDDWIPEETDSAVIARVQQVSAVERLGRHTPMGSDTKKVPRSSGMAVKTLPKSGDYEASNDENDDVLLTARKHTGMVTVAEEDLDDSAADIITQKERDWATSYGKYFDNATLATTAAEATGSITAVPYTSVYYALTQTNATTGYTANDNIVGTVTAGSPSYEELSEVASRHEQSDYFDEADTVVIAHPVFKKALREVMDDQGRPIFVQGQQGDSGTPDRLFDYPIAWSNGARLSATASATPAGAPILVVCNRQFLIVGDRSTVETQPIPAAMSTKDEANIKIRTRKGFGVGHEKAFAVLVDDGSALS
ncbi:phage major capsid protein [Streptomyces sp. FT05W]|nr:phage major capsid protein [Streptomyces sp. FT05W]